MSDFINTIDSIGDEVLINSIIDRSVTEFKDDTITQVGSHAFDGCANLTEIDLPNVNNSEWGVGQNAFRNCTALKSVNLPNWSNVTSSTTYTFSRCTSLEEIVLPLLSKLPLGIFRNCSNLVTADFPKATNIGGMAFELCSNLTSLILRIDSVCTLGATTSLKDSGIANGTGYIYVPKALIEDYKVATNWVTHSAQFRALEDYTVDGTITGELDESKI